MTNPPLHITVAATDQLADHLVLEHELKLVKAALLYADRVTLASPKAAMLAMVSALSGLDGQELTETVLQMVRQFPSPEIHAQYLALKRKKGKTKDEVLALMGFESQLKEAGADLAERAGQMAIDAGLVDLMPALDADLVDLHPLGLEGGSADHIIERFTELLAEIVAEDSLTLPMLDDATGRFLGGMLEVDRVTARLQPLAEAGVAGRFISWVPAFPEASLEAILAAREKLRGPIVRFRAGVMALAKDLGRSPLDDDFEPIVRELFREHVAPALEEISELGHELGLVRSAARTLQAGWGGRAAGATVAFAATAVSEFDALLAAVLGVSGTVVDVVGNELKARREIFRAQRRNQFYLLYELERTVQ